MMSLRRIFGLMLLFLFFEAVVAVVTTLFFPQTDVFFACLAMTGLAIGTWTVFFLLTRLRSQRVANAAAQPKAFVPAPAKVPAGDDSFTLEFNALVAEANRRLQALPATDAKRPAPTIATLPLYLVLGCEGSGKTSVLVNSGLEPRLLAGEAQKDGKVVPTATANIWYAEGAIFVEIAGRLFMQEPARWERALQILGQKSRFPWWKRIIYGDRKTAADLRGVLMVCDTDSLLHANDVRRLGSVARVLNERLQTLQSAMRVDFPAYVFLTKCDSIPHFQEFFAKLSDAEGHRILGVTLSGTASTNEYANIYTEREGSRLKKFYGRLSQSIADKRILFLAREESADKRALAYEFPRELKKLRGEVVQLLLDIFRPSALFPPFRFRGFYFTGKRLVPRVSSAATEETTSPTDTSMVRKSMDATVIFSTHRSSALDFSVQAKNSVDKTTGKWTFLTDVFRQIILTDPAGRVVAQAPRIGDSRSMNIACGAAGLVFLVLSVIWVFSWQRNHHLLTEVQAALRATPATDGRGPLENLRELESLRPVMIQLHSFNRGAAPISYHWGLYSGGRAAAYLDRLYYTSFRQAVLDPTVNAMSGHFLQLQASSPVGEDIYKELKSYRTVTSGNCATDGPLVASMMLRVWTETVSSDAEAQTLADHQIQFYTSELKIGDPYGRRIVENKDAVLRAQTYLRDLTGPDKILQGLVDQVREAPAERLSGYASNYSQVLSGPDQVDGPYTRPGWNGVEDSIRDHKLVSNGEPCVVGSSTGVSGWAGDSTMDSQVQKLYSDDYIRSWKQFLEAHHVVPFASSMDAAQKLRILADNNRSPLLGLIYMTSANTNVAVPQSLRDKAVDGLHNVTAGANKKVSNVFGKLTGDSNKPASHPPTVPEPDQPQTVAAAFDPVHVMVDPGSRDIWLNEKNLPYIKALGALGDSLQALPPQVHNELTTETDQLQQAKTAVSAAYTALHSLAASFRNTSAGIDLALERLLREPIDSAQRTVAAVVVLKAPPTTPTVGGTILPSPPDRSLALAIKASIGKVNASALALCSAEEPLEHKFPFDSDSTTDASLGELDQLLKPGTGAYFQFSNLPDASKTYNHTGRMWAAKPDFPATFSQPFLTALNGFGETEDELYGASGGTAHIDLTLSVDGTGKIPFELDVDGHTMKYSPGHQTPSLHLVWPPITNSPARLVIKNGSKKSAMQTNEWAGLWALFHLLQTADSQSGNVFTFSNVQFGHSLNPLRNEKGLPGTIQITVNSAASNMFSRGYFSKLRCNEQWALQGLVPAN